MVTRDVLKSPRATTLGLYDNGDLSICTHSTPSPAQPAQHSTAQPSTASTASSLNVVTQHLEST